MKYNYCAATQKGAHEKNEDRIFIDGIVLEDGCVSGVLQDAFHAVVCDGVGGEAGGDIAAKCAAESFRNFSFEEPIAASIHNHLLEANDELCFMQKNCPEYRNMSTTVAGVAVKNERLAAFNIGDSRIYRYRDGSLSMLSKDHTLAQHLCDWNEIRDIRDATAAEQSTLTRYLGGGGLTSTPYVKCGKVDGAREILMICSDGVYKAIAEECLVQILGDDKVLEEKEKTILMQAAKNGLDDISLILIECAT